MKVLVKSITLDECGWYPGGIHSGKRSLAGTIQEVRENHRNEDCWETLPIKDTIKKSDCIEWDESYRLMDGDEVLHRVDSFAYVGGIMDGRWQQVSGSRGEKVDKLGVRKRLGRTKRPKESKMGNSKVKEALEAGDWGCRKDDIYKLVEALTGEKMVEKKEVFPCLMKGIAGLFIIDGSTQNGTRHTGFAFHGQTLEYYKSWKDLKPYTGKVTLENVDGKLKVTAE